MASVIRLSPEKVDSDIRTEFLSREGAGEWIGQLSPQSMNQRGSFLTYISHGKDDSNVDAYLVFQPIPHLYPQQTYSALITILHDNNSIDFDMGIEVYRGNIRHYDRNRHPSQKS